MKSKLGASLKKRFVNYSYNLFANYNYNCVILNKIIHYEKQEEVLSVLRFLYNSDHGVVNNIREKLLSEWKD